MKTLAYVVSLMFTYVVMILRKIRSFLKMLFGLDETMSGRLEVVGTKSAQIDLGICDYDCVRVFFTEQCSHVVPCDPGHTDSLNYTMHRDDCGHWVLTVFWSVESPSTIVWSVRF